MERNRESRRGGSAGGISCASGASAARRSRGGPSGPKDASDEEERMDDNSESRPWERPKKDRMSTFQVSLSRNKRKRQGLHEVHAQGRNNICDEADESPEETENAASDDDDEPPPPPIARRSGKFRGSGKVKEDEIVMDIPMVPRKARSTMSSSSRFTVIKRPRESPPVDTVPHQSPAAQPALSNGISSPTLLGKSARKMKPPGTKFRPMKVSKVSEPTTISDQEVEVAEALFVLARSAPSHAGMSETRFEYKSETKIEMDLKAPSPPPPMVFSYSSGHGASVLHTSGNVANGFTQNSSLPVAEAPKRKRPRVVTKPDEGRTPIHLPLQQIALPSEMPHSTSLSGATRSPHQEVEQGTLPQKSPQQMVDESDNVQSELLKVKIASDDAQPLHGEENKLVIQESQGSGQAEVITKEETQVNIGLGQLESADGVVSSPPIEKPADNPAEKECPATIQRSSSCRSNEVHDNDAPLPMMKIDLMAPITMESSMDEGQCLSTSEKQLHKDHSAISSTHYVEASHTKVEEPCERDAAERVEDVSKPNGRSGGINLEQKREAKEKCGLPPFEQLPCSMPEGPEEEEKEKDVDSARTPAKALKDCTDNSLAGLLLPSTPSAAGSSAAPVALAGWMSGLPPMGYYGPGAPSWPTAGPLPGSNLEAKTTHPTVQLPPTVILPPVAKMKRCATHVYVAHFINREQQCSRHSMWSAALCRGAPYSLNIPSVNLLENDKVGGAYTDLMRKGPPQQSNSTGMAVSSSILGCSTPANSMPVSHSVIGGAALETGNGSTASNVMNMAAHAQIIQAMIQQQNGYTFPFTFNAPPGQAPQFFNAPFYPTHLMPPLSHLQSLSQQAPNVVPAQKQQQGLSSLSMSSHSQLQQQPQSSQQQPIPPPALQQQFAPRSPSTSQQPQQSHIGSSAQNFAVHSEKESAESLSTAESRLSAMQRRGKLATKSQHQVHLPCQQSASPPLSLQQQQQFIPQSNAAGAGMQMKVLDPSMSEGFPSMGLSGVGRGSVGPGSLGLLPIASMMASQSHGVIPASSESARAHAQQQQGFGSHNQQYQRALTKSSAAGGSDTFLASSNKGRDSAEDKKSSAKQSGGSSLNLTRGDIEGSLSSMQGSPTSGGTRPGSNAGRTSNPAGAPSRNPRPGSSGGTGQVPLLQNQTPKQAMGRAKTASGPNFSPNAAATMQMVHGYADRAISGNVGKHSGNSYSFPGLVPPSTQASKQGQAGVAGKAAQRMAPGPPQQAPASAMSKTQGQPPGRNNLQQGVLPSVTASNPPRMLPSVSGPIVSSGTLSMPLSNPSSLPKVGVTPASKIASNGKGSVSASKSGQVSSTSKKLPSVTGSSTMTSAMGSGQSMPLKTPVQQKNQIHSSSFPQPQPQPPQQQPQQMNISVQQQRLGTKNHVYPQQQLQQPQQGSQYKPSVQAQSPYRSDVFLHQQSQYVQQPSQQLPVPSQQSSQLSSHHFQPNSQNSSTQYVQTQHRAPHDQQHLAPHMTASSPLSAPITNGLSLNSSTFSFGTGLADSISSNTSSKGVEQFPGAGTRANSSKVAPSLGNGLVENMTTLHASGSMMAGAPLVMPAAGPQVSSPHSGSSHFFQLSPVLSAKPTEPKNLPEGMSREEINGARHLPSTSPSPSQPPLMPNPTSS